MQGTGNGLGTCSRTKNVRSFHDTVSLRARAMLLATRFGVKPLVKAWVSAPDRTWPLAFVDQAARWIPQPRDIHVRKVALPQCRAEMIRAERSGTARVILYLHGGAFLTCGLNTHRPLVSCLSRSCDAAVLNVDYRMLPRHPISSAVSDALDAYRWLLDTGYRPRDIVIAGDSAGGYLAFMTALTIARRPLPPPAGVVAISPLTDVSPDRADCTRDKCPMFPPGAAAVLTRYLARAHARITVDGEPGPLASPVDEDLSAMPPVMIHAGAHELLRGDAELMSNRLQASGVPCELHIWRGQVHAFTLAGNATPESRRAIELIGRFVRNVTKAPSRAPRMPARMRPPHPYFGPVPAVS